MISIPITILLLLIVGLVLGFYSLSKYKDRDVYDKLSSRDRMSTSMWKQREWFISKTGYYLYILGNYLVILGALIGFIYFIWLK